MESSERSLALQYGVVTGVAALYFLGPSLLKWFRGGYAYQRRRRSGPLHVIITGASKGFGLSLVARHLLAGDRVVAACRSAQQEELKKILRQQWNVEEDALNHRLIVITCDIRNDESIGEMCTKAKEFFEQTIPSSGEGGGGNGFVPNALSHIDLFICNAAAINEPRVELCEMDARQVQLVMRTNGLGLLLSVRHAQRLIHEMNAGKKKEGEKNGVFSSSPRTGHVVVIGGGGGQNKYPTPTFAPYGFLKAGQQQLMATLRQEESARRLRKKKESATEEGICAFHVLYPGMMDTDMMKSTSDTLIKRALCDHPDRVAQWAVQTWSNLDTEDGCVLSYRSVPGMMLRIALAFFHLV